jgi:hypothetical protein
MSYKKLYCLPFASTRVHPGFFVGVRVIHLYSFFVYLRSEFRVLMPDNEDSSEVALTYLSYITWHFIISHYVKLPYILIPYLT